MEAGLIALLERFINYIFDHGFKEAIVVLISLIVSLIIYANKKAKDRSDALGKHLDKSAENVEHLARTTDKSIRELQKIVTKLDVLSVERKGQHDATKDALKSLREEVEKIGLMINESKREHLEIKYEIAMRVKELSVKVEKLMSFKVKVKGLK